MRGEMRPELGSNEIFYFSISIRASHAGYDRIDLEKLFETAYISIHASHAGCDVVRQAGRDSPGHISIHASHARCD